MFYNSVGENGSLLSWHGRCYHIDWYMLLKIGGCEEIWSPRQSAGHLMMMMMITRYSECIEKQKILWFEHLLGVQHNQLPRHAYNKMRSSYMKTTKRSINNIKDILNKQGYSASERTHLPLERKLKLPLLHLTTSVDQLYHHPLGRTTIDNMKDEETGLFGIPRC